MYFLIPEAIKSLNWWNG